jgi:hypothetical protein
MPLSEFETKMAESALRRFLAKRRPPPEIRNQVDLAYRIDGLSLELFELRRRFLRPEEVAEHPIAKATYVRKANVWNVFWMRPDLKWHRYEPTPQVASVDDFLLLVDRDPHACFFG